MNLIKSIKISVNVIMIFGIAISMSIVPELYPSFFGDWKCVGNYKSTTTLYHGCMEYYNMANELHEPTMHWGYRHFLYLFMGIALFLIQVSRVVYLINKNDKINEKKS